MLIPESSIHLEGGAQVLHLFTEITEIEYFKTGCRRWLGVQGAGMSTAWTVRKVERRLVFSSCFHLFSFFHSLIWCHTYLLASQLLQDGVL